jgi:hypothetical protein
MRKALQNWLNPTESTTGQEQDADTSCISSEVQEDTYESYTEAIIRQKSETDSNEDQQSHESDAAAEIIKPASEPEDYSESSNENKDLTSSALLDGLSSNCPSDSEGEVEIDFNNPQTWLPITDKKRCLLVMHGPDQASDPYRMSISTTGRHFSEEYYNKVLPNRQIVRRNWLFYSVTCRACFCFPCILFLQSKSSASGLCHPDKGVYDWKHITEKLSQHENNPLHKEHCLKWKELEQRLKNGQAIDMDIQQAIELEKSKWRSILAVVVDCILFCAKNNLALRVY